MRDIRPALAAEAVDGIEEPFNRQSCTRRPIRVRPQAHAWTVVSQRTNWFADLFIRSTIWSSCSTIAFAWETTLTFWSVMAAACSTFWASCVMAALCSEDACEISFHPCRSVGHFAVDSLQHFLCRMYERCALLYLRRPCAHRLHREPRFSLNHLNGATDFVCRGAGSFGELSYFVSDDRKSSTDLAGPCSLNRSVEREQICLISDLVDDRRNLADLIRSLSQHLDLLGGRRNG